MPIVLFAGSVLVAFVISVVLFEISFIDRKKPSMPLFEGVLMGIAVAAGQYFLLIARSGGEGAILAPLVGVMLIPSALLGGIAAGLAYGRRGRSLFRKEEGPAARKPFDHSVLIAWVNMIAGGLLLARELLILLSGRMTNFVSPVMGAIILAAGLLLRTRKKGARMLNAGLSVLGLFASGALLFLLLADPGWPILLVLTAWFGWAAYSLLWKFSSDPG